MSKPIDGDFLANWRIVLCILFSFSGPFGTTSTQILAQSGEWQYKFIYGRLKSISSKEKVKFGFLLPRCQTKAAEKRDKPK